ncbi:MAG TPA: CBS domain-containing protein [Candidatus Acidoferrales bacterium]|nr:CBS domain-containing protein [Candidatus Acidoferrales bacterium]
MRAKEIMTKDVITVSPSTRVREVALLLTKNNISGVPVRDRNGQIVGIVSQSDIIGKKGKQVKDIMSKSIVSVSEDTQVEEIAALMIANRIDRVLVMDNAELLGIVSQADIVGAIAAGKHVAVHSPVTPSSTSAGET